MNDNILDSLKPYLGDLNALVLFSRDKKGREYAQPALKNLGSVVVPVLRETISPAIFRNAEAEITDITYCGVRRIRAVANKFKFGERSRGLQVLRQFEAGGRQPQNRTLFDKDARPSTAYDMNTLVYGDSANHGNRVLPVKATAQYSDAVSVQDYASATDVTFHNRAAEDGTLFDAQRKENSSNIFERHFVKPGTFFLQTIAFNGRTAPIEALKHFLLCLGLAGAYGGQTSIYGINVRNHVMGIYAGRFERDIASPYAALEKSGLGNDSTLGSASEELHELFSAVYPVRVDAGAVSGLQNRMIDAVEKDDDDLKQHYHKAQVRTGEFFDQWFGGFGNSA